MAAASSVPYSLDMTLSMVAAPGQRGGAQETGYVAGVCNIGPDEIARRRRAGHVGVLITLALLVALLAIDAPPAIRFVIALPAASAASGYLQAWLKFCAGFGSMGVFNFGQLGRAERVVDPAARRRDRVRALQIGAASAAIGAVVGLVAFATAA
jgi:hypothetical protein